MFLKTFLSFIPNIKVININGISGMHGLKNICVYALPFRKYFLRTCYMFCNVRTLFIYVLHIYITYTIPFLVYPYVVCQIINLLTINNSIMLKAVMYGPFYLCTFLMMETSFFDVATFSTNLKTPLILRNKICYIVFFTSSTYRHDHSTMDS